MLAKPGSERVNASSLRPSSSKRVTSAFLMGKNSSEVVAKASDWNPSWKKPCGFNGSKKNVVFC